MTDISAPLFDFGGTHELVATDAHTRPAISGGTLALTGPSVTAAAGHLPVRGDLAHIKLAGLYFVPHYAAPMPHVVKQAGASLRKSDKPDAEEIGTLSAGTTFDVLDITGGWTWGQYGEDGPVGYVLLAELEAES